jgi:hypothetical protein
MDVEVRHQGLRMLNRHAGLQLQTRSGFIDTCDQALVAGLQCRDQRHLRRWQAAIPAAQAIGRPGRQE